MDYQFTEAASTAYQNLYSNFDGLADSFAGYWKQLAAIYVNNPFVIGYELMNEPWAGDVFKDPFLLVPGEADRKNLQPMYNVLNDAIRSVDQEHAIFFESVTWDITPVGFDEVPGGPDYRNRSVLAYHFYVPPDLSATETFLARALDIKRLDCGGFLTEFWVDQSQTMAQQLGTVEKADEHRQSWMAWDYKLFGELTGDNIGFFYENGTLNAGLLSVLVRTYPMAVAGHILSYSFEQSSGAFKLDYEANCAIIDYPTDIFACEALVYSTGYSVTAAPSDHVIINTTLNHVYVWNKPGISGLVSITIERK